MLFPVHGDIMPEENFLKPLVCPDEWRGENLPFKCTDKGCFGLWVLFLAECLLRNWIPLKKELKRSWAIFYALTVACTIRAILIINGPKVRSLVQLPLETIKQLIWHLWQAWLQDGLQQDILILIAHSSLFRDRPSITCLPKRVVPTERATSESCWVVLSQNYSVLVSTIPCVLNRFFPIFYPHNPLITFHHCQLLPEAVTNSNVLYVILHCDCPRRAACLPPEPPNRMSEHVLSGASQEVPISNLLLNWVSALCASDHMNGALPKQS